MKKAKQIGILVAVLTAVFALGFLAGISSARPLKSVFPTRSPVEDPQPEEFVQNFASRMTQHLNLTKEQKPEVEDLLREMSERIRNAQRDFIPKIDQALLETIDKILPLLTEEQKKILLKQRHGIANSQRFNSIGRPFSPGPPGRRRPGGGPPPWGDGPPPWGDGPPPWVREAPPEGTSQSARPQRPPAE